MPKILMIIDSDTGQIVESVPFDTLLNNIRREQGITGRRRGITGRRKLRVGPERLVGLPAPSKGQPSKFTCGACKQQKVGREGSTMKKIGGKVKVVCKECSETKKS